MIKIGRENCIGVDSNSNEVFLTEKLVRSLESFCLHIISVQSY